MKVGIYITPFEAILTMYLKKSFFFIVANTTASSVKVMH